MAMEDKTERTNVPWTSPGPVRAVGIAPEGQEPFVPSEREMEEGVEAARRVDSAFREAGGPKD